jgi:hypothetical protein
VGWAHKETQEIVRTKPVCYWKERYENTNCRNEAKKYLKTRELLKNLVGKAEKLLKTSHIALLNAADLEHFLCKCSKDCLKTSPKTPQRATLEKPPMGLHEAKDDTTNQYVFRRGDR